MASPAYPSQFSMPLLWLHTHVTHVPSVSHLLFPIPSNPPIYPPLQKPNTNMISKEITGLSNRISDLPEEICISRNIKPIIEM